MPSAQNKLKIIIADECLLFRDGLASLLKNTNKFSKIATAADGSEVIGLLNSGHYDIVLMDVRMKPVDGIEATGIIHKKFPGTRVIAFSMYNDCKLIKDMLKKGAMGYILKNANVDVIMEAVGEVMDGKKYLSKDASAALAEEIADGENIPGNDRKEKLLNGERIKADIFLISHGFSAKEIAGILLISERSIGKDKEKIFDFLGERKLSAIIEFSISEGIHHDPELKKRFKKELEKKTDKNDH